MGQDAFRLLFFYLLFNEPSSRFLKIQIKIKIRFHVFVSTNPKFHSELFFCAALCKLWSLIFHCGDDFLSVVEYSNRLIIGQYFKSMDHFGDFCHHLAAKQIIVHNLITKMLISRFYFYFYSSLLP